MVKLLWGTLEERHFESGVDRGVLFVNGVGCVWNGLKSINEIIDGGSAKPLYLDGVKYLNLSDSEEFSATINALSAPFEFDECDGSLRLYAGLYVTHQPRTPFGLSYRVKLGDDISGLDLGYKIHLVYNAYSGPSSRDRASLGGSTDPISLSWTINTVPPNTEDIRPTTHLIIDSRTTDPVLLQSVEDIVYGTDISDSRLPTPSELISLFTD